jgi:hypothetical protein
LVELGSELTPSRTVAVCSDSQWNGLGVSWKSVRNDLASLS